MSPFRTPVTRRRGAIIAAWILVLAVAVAVFAVRGAHRLIPGTEATLEEKIGQMVMVGFRGTAIDNDSMYELKEQLKDGAVGGIVWYDYNVVSPKQVKRLNAAFDRYAKRPLFIAVDEEGGRVSRLGADKGFADHPSPADVARSIPPAEAKTFWRPMAVLLAEYGFTVNFAPGVDVNINPDSPAIGALGRSFSDDPAVVERYAKAFIGAMRSERIIPVIKHFPGHGSAGTDSHEGITDITDTWREKELTPFARLIDEGLARAVMTAHVMDKNRDPENPATLSPAFITDLLRNRLGFTGVVFTDDLQMGAIEKTRSFENTVIDAVLAGNDVLVYSNYFHFDPRTPWKVRDILLEAVSSGVIDESRIDASYRRIMALKARMR